jgi:hypothetical protein
MNVSCGNLLHLIYSVFLSGGIYQTADTDMQHTDTDRSNM